MSRSLIGLHKLIRGEFLGLGFGQPSKKISRTPAKVNIEIELFVTVEILKVGDPFELYIF